MPRFSPIVPCPPESTLVRLLLLGLLGVACSPPAPSPDPAPTALAGPDAAIPRPIVPDDPPPVRNLAPTVKGLRISPKEPSVGQPVHVEAEGSDPEGVTPTFRYTWSVNGSEDLSQHSADFDTQSLHSGDVLAVTVTAHDDEQDSGPVHGEVKLRGLPPILDTLPGQIHSFDNVRMRAHDPDGGAIVWSLRGGPTGMSVEAGGLLHYAGTEMEPGGAYHIVIAATDPDGDYANLELDITIAPGSKAKAAADAKAASEKSAQ